MKTVIDGSFIELRPSRQMDRDRRIRLDANDQILVNLLRDERDRRSQQFGESNERMAQGGQGSGVAIPEAPPVEPNIPVAEFVDKVGDGASGRSDIVGLVGGSHVADEPVQFGE